MNDPQRAKFVEQIQFYSQAIKSTTSVYLQRDYQKRLNKVRKELRAYDRYRKYGCRSNPQ